MKPTGPIDSCPCGSGRDYRHCCGPLHAGAPAADAQALMRSRYSAFVKRDADYLLATWHVSTRPARLDFEPAGPTWLGLAIQEFVVNDADHAQVRFVARYRSGGGSAQRQSERSRFVREAGRWYYVDGEVAG